MSKKGSSWKDTPNSFKRPQGGKCALDGCNENQISRFAPYCSEGHRKQAATEREQRHFQSGKNWNWKSPEVVCAYCKHVLGPGEKEYCQKCINLGKGKRRG